ncbi:MAG: class I SAM-dependent methyltransferase [Thermoleophilia bacterium]|nr:class I SAM-dependent methyltransferase [Thermoleophilia bacterium]
MERFETAVPLRGDDPGQWGASMANMSEIMFPVLDAAGVRSLAEIGAYAGDLTAVLLEWAGPAGATVIAVDPTPQQALLDLAEERAELRLEQATSLDAIPRMDLPDAFIIDGDHNYFTVSEELKLIEERAGEAAIPLLLFHDVCWPHARRDAYYAPDRIPEEYRSTIASGVGIAPGEPGLTYGGLPYVHVQEREGGERNGVLTAIEDFLEERPGLEFALLPMFFGFGVCCRRDAPYAGALRSLTAPLDRNPVIARLEWNRVCTLAESHVARTHLAVLKEKHTEQQARCRRQEDLLREVERSTRLRIAEKLARFRRRDQPDMRARIAAELDSGASATDPA